MSELSARLELPFLQPSQAQKHVTHNEALLRLDTVTQLVIEQAQAETPPGPGMSLPWGPLMQNLDGLGIGASADATNRLSVAADATLLRVERGV